jgi:HEAT repeat protein
MRTKIVVLVAIFGGFLAGCEQNQSANKIATDPLADPAALPPVSVGGLHEDAIAVIDAGLQDDIAPVRSNAVEVVATTKEASFLPQVQSMLTDENVMVRFSAAMALGDMKYKPAQEALEAGLGDRDENVRLASAYALEQLGAMNDRKIFDKGLASLDQTVRANAALIVGKLGDKSYIPKLQDLIQDPRSADRVRFQAIESIARLGDERVYHKLWTMLISTYADDRLMGIRSMGALGTVAARNAIVTVLDDQILEVRLAAAEQLGQMGEKTGEREVLDYLEGKKLSSEEKAARRPKALAALAIGRIGTEDLKKYLPQLLKSDSKQVRLAAANSVLLLEKQQ